MTIKLKRTNTNPSEITDKLAEGEVLVCTYNNNLYLIVGDGTGDEGHTVSSLFSSGKRVFSFTMDKESNLINTNNIISTINDAYGQIDASKITPTVATREGANEIVPLDQLGISYGTAGPTASPAAGGPAVGSQIYIKLYT